MNCLTPDEGSRYLGPVALVSRYLLQGKNFKSKAQDSYPALSIRPIPLLIILYCCIPPKILFMRKGGSCCFNNN